MGEELATLDKEIASEALDDASVARLITITGVKGRWTGFVSYRGQSGSRWQDNGGTAGVRIAF